MGSKKINLHLCIIRYLSIQKLPNRMLSLRKSNTTNNESASGEEEGIAILGDKGSGDEEIHKKLVDIRSCPFEIGDLKIISLGNIACFELRIIIHWAIGICFYSVLCLFLIVFIM